MTSPQPDVERTYRERYPIYANFAARVAALTHDCLGLEGIPIANLEHRAKTPESVAAKLTRKAYSDPLVEISDFAGVRIITYYNDDVDRVVKIIRREFAVDDARSLDKLAELDVDEFGYRSVHLVCSLSPGRRVLPEWTAYGSLVVEIQIRSVLQHAWAAISHKIDYKSAAEAPSEVRRQLFRLSALLELADDQFLALRDRTTSVSLQYSTAISHGELKIPLNLESLRHYVVERLDLREWEQLGLTLGMARRAEPHTSLEEDLSELLTTMRALQVETLDELDDLIGEHRRDAEALLRPLVVKAATKGYPFQAVPVDIINALITLGEVPKRGLRYRWAEPWHDTIVDAMNELLTSP